MRYISILFIAILLPAGIASGQVTFAESALQLGLDELDFGIGVAILDIDGDGTNEIITSSSQGHDRLYKWDGTIYRELAQEYGFLPTDDHHCITIADVDKPGKPDIYITGNLYGGHGHFYINQNGWSFSDMALEYNLFDVDDMGSAFFQLSQIPTISILRGTRLLTLQEEAFIDITNGSGLENLSNVFVPLFLDIDGDIDDDLFVVHNWEGMNASLYRNNGNDTFTEISENTNEGMFAATCCGTTGDYDGDGDIDIYQLSGYSHNVLWQNDGTGYFTNVTEETNTGYLGYTRSANFADFDNDGDLDIFLNRALDYNMLLLNDGNDSFIDFSYDAHVVDSLNGAGSSVGDLNNDGQLDIVTVNSSFTAKQVYINQNQNGSFVKFRLIGQPGNSLALGAIIKLYGIANGGQDTSIIGTRELSSLSTMSSVNEPIVHFGTGTFQNLLARIYFKSATYVEIGDISPGQALLVYEPEVNSIENGESQLPINMALTAYPNPFNANTKIGFSLDSPGKVSLNIYSLTGELVNVLIREQSLGPGDFNVLWNACDMYGNGVTSGVYFIRLSKDKGALNCQPVTLLR